MFITDKNNPAVEMPLRRLRALIATMYVAYPLGCVLQILFTDDGAASLVADMTGLALVLASAVAFLLVARTSVQRIMHVAEAELDERELTERWRAHQSAYGAFSALALALLIYLALALDFADRAPFPIWTPTTFEHWNALFWAGFLLAVTLPTAFYAFASRADAPEDDESGPAG